MYPANPRRRAVGPRPTASAPADIVLQQTQTWYDAAGEAVALATYQQFAGDADSDALTAADSYTTADATWYDPFGRVVATANFGREDAGAPAGGRGSSPYNLGTALLLLRRGRRPHAARPGRTRATSFRAMAASSPAVCENAPPATGSYSMIVALTIYNPAGPVGNGRSDRQRRDRQSDRVRCGWPRFRDL